MIRRDYILRMVEEFIRVLAQIRVLKKEGRVEMAADLIDREFQRLIGKGSEAVSGLSETELLAFSIAGEATQAARDKRLILTTLLKEAGDLAAEQGRIHESRDAYL